jgi:uncharacterized protein
MAHAFDALNNHSYISLTTFKKSGDAVPTPVWFVRDGDKLYVTTIIDTGKAKRIRNNKMVTIAPCDMRGNVKGDKMNANAVILPEADFKHANDLLNKKYGLFKRVFDFFQRNKQHIYIAITA